MEISNRISLNEIFSKYNEFDGKELLVCGWIRNIRVSKVITFIELNDGSYFKSAQIVLDQDNVSNYKEISQLNIGSSILLKGKLKITPEAKQPFEIVANEVEISGVSTPSYPLQSKRHSMEFLRDIAHLRPRTNTFMAVFRVRSVIAHAIHDFFYKNGFVYVHTPIITSSDCEGAGEMFRVTTLEDLNKDDKEDFFGKKTGLTVSGQLAGECFAMAFSKIYTFGPTFRAENSHTGRHAAEFWMIEPEMAFCDLEENMNTAEKLMKYIINSVLNECNEEVEFFNTFIDKELKERLEHVANSDFARVTYKEAVKLLEKENDKFEYEVHFGTDLQTEHERYLTEKIFKKPVFVTDYPKDIKAFYMKQNSDDITVRAMDLLVPGIGEIIGGSQREESLEKLKNRMQELGMQKDEYEWYLDTRKYGSCIHSGFGLGFERAVMYLTGMSNIRDVIPFPRTPGNCLY